MATAIALQSDTRAFTDGLGEPTTLRGTVGVGGARVRVGDRALASFQETVAVARHLSRVDEDFRVDRLGQQATGGEERGKSRTGGGSQCEEEGQLHLE